MSLRLCYFRIVLKSDDSVFIKDRQRHRETQGGKSGEGGGRGRGKKDSLLAPPEHM